MGNAATRLEPGDSSPAGSQHHSCLCRHCCEECYSNRSPLGFLPLSLQRAHLPPALCPPLAPGGPDYRPHSPHHEARDHLLESEVGLSPSTCRVTSKRLGHGEGSSHGFASSYCCFLVGGLRRSATMWGPNRGELEPGHAGHAVVTAPRASLPASLPNSTSEA